MVDGGRVNTHTAQQTNFESGQYAARDVEEPWLRLSAEATSLRLGAAAGATIHHFKRKTRRGKKTRWIGRLTCRGKWDCVRSYWNPAAGS